MIVGGLALPKWLYWDKFIDLISCDLLDISYNKSNLQFNLIYQATLFYNFIFI